MITALALTLAGFGPVSTAEAADPEFSETKKDGKAVEKPEAKLGAEFGGALTTGNSEFYTLSAGLNGSYRWKRSRFTLVGAAVNGSARVDADGDGTLSDPERAVPMVENARRAGLDLRYDFFLSKKSSLYASFGVFHDRFQSLDFRLTEQLGYSRNLIKNDDTVLVVEGGFAAVQENYTADVDPGSDSFVAVRLMAGLTHKFSEGVGFEERVEIFENLLDFEDLRLINTASLTSALSSKLSLKLSHQLLFDNQPVKAEFRKVDQSMQVTLVASIL
jgi:putative salt-induced outer membrane protein YdiY